MCIGFLFLTVKIAHFGVSAILHPYLVVLTNTFLFFS